ncbi:MULTISPECIES: universal stress protein [unclassified Undibacterium]|uniref:universal stress protein n=1 Tax=unclassified Undibacterium TaxID=2630295 RepID=UPI002AC8F288|nr:MULTISPECIES: universal stress protein [unclassified Undibacterium]MEB0139354.1 universal stress protein [Undibacterium sp. CCC2.1]MEB0172198.1 universal stress protein [Undibacterium sp. CCC1.1]MEB0176012.1 universal stress protein [Undibacterium sp. CCC3.4]MEB0215324.1 universal stress protein [Undibacterium sp. 5I2]WPX43400.1 universal stress protein [Undibacterium sp. CCC3.4]
MYHKILLPTDGSELASAGITAGIAFAKQIEAQVVAVFVAGNYQYPIYIDIIPPNTPTEADYQATMRTVGDSYLEAARTLAEEAGVSFTGVVEFNDSAAKQIVRTACQQGCDLIFMGSHGRSGLGQLLLGSTTAKVLSLCDIAVLVHRTKVR